jgi:hypothetical protein
MKPVEFDRHVNSPMPTTSTSVTQFTTSSLARIPLHRKGETGLHPTIDMRGRVRSYISVNTNGGAAMAATILEFPGTRLCRQCGIRYRWHGQANACACSAVVGLLPPAA